LEVATECIAAYPSRYERIVAEIAISDEMLSASSVPEVAPEGTEQVPFDGHRNFDPE
jgi:hypothetical protein